MLNWSICSSTEYWESLTPIWSFSERRECWPPNILILFGIVDLPFGCFYRACVLAVNHGASSSRSSPRSLPIKKRALTTQILEFGRVSWILEWWRTMFVLCGRSRVNLRNWKCTMRSSVGWGRVGWRRRSPRLSRMRCGVISIVFLLGPSPSSHLFHFGFKKLWPFDHCFELLLIVFEQLSLSWKNFVPYVGLVAQLQLSLPFSSLNCFEISLIAESSYSFFPLV